MSWSHGMGSILQGLLWYGFRSTSQQGFYSTRNWFSCWWHQRRPSPVPVPSLPPPLKKNNEIPTDFHGMAMNRHGCLPNMKTYENILKQKSFGVGVHWSITLAILETVKLVVFLQRTAFWTPWFCWCFCCFVWSLCPSRWPAEGRHHLIHP